MVRVKRGFIARMKRKKILKFTVRFKGKSSCLLRISKAKIMKALSYSYTGRKRRKCYFKSISIIRINAFLVRCHVLYKVIRKKCIYSYKFKNRYVTYKFLVLCNNSLSFSQLAKKLNKNNIILSAKMLAQLSIIDKLSLYDLIKDLMVG